MWCAAVNRQARQLLFVPPPPPLITPPHHPHFIATPLHWQECTKRLDLECKRSMRREGIKWTG